MKDKIDDASNPLAFVYLRWVKIQKYKINDASNPLALLLTTRESAFSRGALVKHSDTRYNQDGDGLFDLLCFFDLSRWCVFIYLVLSSSGDVSELFYSIPSGCGSQMYI